MSNSWHRCTRWKGYWLRRKKLARLRRNLANFFLRKNVLYFFTQLFYRKA